ncbi:hypothetical protein CVT26_015901 [Gymnopilus dilepis]|uniref:Uncharacterized protein n=1 Tax=Gymnopilus dilepis TaxID=231916 RepID=A0A409WHJ1_9AGAR|nr:hypothetical protein CVT26_015901 [Gymnopilus dilepis]
MEWMLKVGGVASVPDCLTPVSTLRPGPNSRAGTVTAHGCRTRLRTRPSTKQLRSPERRHGSAGATLQFVELEKVGWLSAGFMSPAEEGYHES